MVSQELYDRYRIAHCEAKFYFPESVGDFLERIDLNSHQWLLEFNNMNSADLQNNIHLQENIDELTGCSVGLYTSLGVYVMQNKSALL